MRFLIVGVLLLLNVGLSAQEVFNGQLVDFETGEPLAFAHLIKKHSNVGTITNADGRFKFLGAASDTIVISFISYERTEIPASYFTTNETLKVKRSLNELETFTVLSDYDFVLDALLAGRKKLQRVTGNRSKAYFSLETIIGDRPTELIECYYNATTGSGLNQLKLKNGRIAMSSSRSGHFVSLSTTKIISNYDFFVKAGNNFANNPLHYTKSGWKKLYNYKLVGLENGVYKIQFTPKKKNGQEFDECYIWLDKASTSILKLTLIDREAKKHPFAGVKENHKVEALNYRISYDFTGGSNQNLEKIEFDYDFIYNNGQAKGKVNTAGLFLFYDQNQLFDLPNYTEQATPLTDYDKIVSLPHNATFWKNNEVILPSEKTLRYLKFFKENGVLLNYNNLTYAYDFFEQKLLHWNEKRFFPYQLLGDDKAAPEAIKKKVLFARAAPYTLAKLPAQIYLDPNSNNGTASYFSKAVLNAEYSFYLLDKSKFSVCYMNVYFDLVEIERRKLDARLKEKAWTSAEVDSIHALAQTNLEALLHEFSEACNYGRKEAPLLPYIAQVKEALGVDNSILIVGDSAVAAFDTLGISKMNRCLTRYHYGNHLMDVGDYSTSLEVLHQAAKSGGEHAWLDFNIGWNHMKLGNNRQACIYFRRAKQLGHELPAEAENYCQTKDE